ncbi:MAG: FGGY-family carbohydrate kinase [Candidatus Ranarchaeia archaeon]
METVAVIDAGTTGIRSMVFSVAGDLLASAYEEYPSYFPTPVMVEQDAEQWWKVTCRTLKNTINQLKTRNIEVKGVTVTNQRETIVPVTKDGTPLRNAIAWQDRRTTKECEMIRSKLGTDTVYHRTGLTIDPYFSATKIAWILNNQPRIATKTRWFFLVHDFLVFKLTGQSITDWSNASRTMLFNIRKHAWDQELCESIGVSIDRLPTPRPSGEIIGGLTDSAHRETGLPPGVLVLTGGGDQQCAALGVGVTRPGRVKVTTGTGSFILGYTLKPKHDPKKRLLCSCHTIKDAYVIEASIFTTGALLRWARDQMGSAEVAKAKELGLDPYDILCDEASKIPPGSDGLVVLPHFVGAGAPYWDPFSKGAIVGLAMGHTRAHIIRAILEAVYYEVRRNLTVMEKLGLRIKEVRITGGGSRNEIWNQIAADICQVSIWKGIFEEATALGAAVLATYGIGYYKNIEQASLSLVKNCKLYYPNPEKKRIYTRIIKIQDQIYHLFSKNKIFRCLTGH